ncbi:MAG: murein biosynthesis integral membrane protein MurJ [candidate division Zixibacteria bacterium]|nr:murein biosynthesis integral membrane protein MurJ [candidate division Zixibacteria bacterium]
MATALSRVSGLLREQVMAYFFGASMATDAFVTAFRIPNLLRDLFAEGALSSSFVPVFKDKMVNEGDDQAFDLGNTVMTSMLIVVSLVVVLGIIASPLIVYLTAHGFAADKEKFDLTVDLTRIMWVFLLLVSVAALVMGMLNSMGRFGVPAFSSTAFNFGGIATVWIWAVVSAPDHVSAYALAVGVVIGGIGQLAVQLPTLKKTGYRFRPRFNFGDAAFRKMLKLITPMVIGLSASRINILVSTLLASLLAEGAISYLNYSFRLMHFPLGVFAVALGTVALTKASEQAARKDMDGLAGTFLEAFNLNMLFIIPSAMFFIFFAKDFVGLAYRYGQFSESDTLNTAFALIHYSYGLIGFAAVRVIVPVYYALTDSKLPMKISVLTVLLNILSYWPLVKLMDFGGLAAATSIAGLVNAGLLLAYLPSRGVPVPFVQLGSTFIRMAIAATVAFGVARMLRFDLWPAGHGLIGRFVNLLGPLAVAGVLYGLLCYLLHVREIRIVLNKLLKR